MVASSYQGTIAGNSALIAMGLIVGPEAAAVAALEKPLTDGDSSHWLWHHYLPVFVPNVANDRVNVSSERYEIDSRGMRKLSDTDVVQMCIQNFSNQGVAVDVMYAMRFLFRD